MALFAVEALLQQGVPHIHYWALPLLAWGYLQYRWVGRFRTREGGGGPGIAVPPDRLVRVGPYRRAVVLPDSLRRREVAGARMVGDRVEITSGLDANARVVASGTAFLADGDTVRVVDAPAAAAMQPSGVSAAGTAATAATK